jgi:hypothetical protein
MRKKIFSLIKKVMINYGEMAMLSYCPTEVGLIRRN